jgi:nephrocystin-3
MKSFKHLLEEESDMPEQRDKDQIQKIPPASGSKRKRNIRVFISSTFQDMQEERDILIKKVFPELRKICMERGVGFTEVDLRWGVTREQAERGEVLPICLAEIENCRPYFIGLLGERYGWVPDSIPDELIDDQPWLAEHRQRSVTELEIVHGVLNNPDMADHAFFYFRDPKALGPVEQDQESINKQTALKDRIRKSGFPVSENYPDAEAVGQLVLKDLEQAINIEFPEQQLTPLERDRLDHEVFAESRSKVYIGRQEYFDHLDDHALGVGDPLVVLGESGSGKSALLANWCFRFREKHPDTFLLSHFIGSSMDSTDHIAMLRRIMLEIKEHYDLPNDILDTPEELRSQFPNWLSMAAAQGRFVLVLDALNQLEDKDNAPDLVWLPEFIPPDVKLIVSTLPGRSLDELEKRDWPTMEVQLLEPEERQQLITEYLLKLYAKRLPQDLVERIAFQEQCANPLYLHALLEELRIFGKHAEIQSRVDHYLQANDPEKLYEMVLTRLEEDYEKDRPGLVGEAMTLLWAARRGLSESELLAIMDLPRLIWSPLFLALQDSLVIRSGLLTFFHDFLRQAVHAKYIKTPESEKAAHLRLADYFKDRDIDQRKIDELPWQLAEAQEWKRLQGCLVDPPFFKAAYANDEFEVLAYWQRIEENSDLTCPAAYENVLAAPDEFIDVIFPLSALFYTRGNLNEALQLWKAQEKHYRVTGDIGNLQASLGGQALILKDRGDLDGAMALHKEEERICRELGNVDGLQMSLLKQAFLLAKGMSQPREALPLAEEAYELASAHGPNARVGKIKLILDDLRAMLH